MSQAFIGEIKLFAGTYAPRNWALCAGQILPIVQNQALFAIIGTIYGGDGRTTLQLPDLRGRAAVGAGQSPGLSDYPVGTRLGAEQVQLTAAQIPQVPVSVNVAIPSVSNTDADMLKPSATASMGNPPGTTKIYSNATPDGTMKPFTATGSTQGSGQAFDNRTPLLALNYIICINGLFPSRN